MSHSKLLYCIYLFYVLSGALRRSSGGSLDSGMVCTMFHGTAVLSSLLCVSLNWYMRFWCLMIHQSIGPIHWLHLLF